MKEAEDSIPLSSLNTETPINGVTSVIQKLSTSKPSNKLVQEITASTDDPDTEISKPSKIQLSNAETLQDPETSTEIYPKAKSTALDISGFGGDHQ